MSAGAGLFLAGARSRLLPASIPFRYFGAAVAFHLLAWGALAAGWRELPRFGGGLGWPLAALHLVTLGVLVMSAIGASLQLLPVATRQPVRWLRAPVLVWWLYTPGVVAVALGMGLAWPRLLAVGAGAVLLALAIFAVVLADNLRGARGMPVVVAHGWAALACLVGVGLTAATLAAGWLGHALLDRSAALALHLVFAVFGFMGLLSFGLSYILVPMFALAPAPAPRPSLVSAVLAMAAIALAAAAGVGAAQPLRLAALAIGAIAVALHLRLMHGALRSGMRRSLGLSFTMIRLAWAMLVASLALALAIVLAAPVDGLPALFALFVLGGWLLSFLFGMLQRILPFLASMHLARGQRRAPTASALSSPRPLAWHFRCHVAALAGLALAMLVDSRGLALAAACVGTAGAVAFGLFWRELRRRMRGGTAPEGPGTDPSL